MFGDRVIPGFVPDDISAIVATFFSDLRADKWKSLKHTPNKGLLLAGPKGIGKTENLRTFAKMVANDGNLNRRPRIVSVKQIQEGYKQAQENSRGAQFVEDLSNCPELIIDDIGSEDARFNDFGTVRNLISDILFQRYINFQRGACITHGTTNFNPDTLAEIYDARLIDRMKEMFVFQIVKGDSKRTNPIKEVRIESTLITEITEADKRRIYLNGFVEHIKSDAIIPFYDKGPMWAFLVNNGLINPIVLEDFDIKKLAMDIERKEYDKLSFAKSYTDIEALKRTYNQETEIEKITKHLILMRFLKENELDLSTYTNEQIML